MGIKQTSNKSNFIQNKEHINIDKSTDLVRNIDTFINELNSCYLIKELKLTNCNLGENEVSLISNGIINNKNLISLDLSYIILDK